MSEQQSERTRGRIELRPVEPPDIDVFFAHEHDPVASVLAGVKPRERTEFYRHWDRILADESVTERAILIDGTVAGRISSFITEGRLELGYWIGRELWGRGVASRAMGLFLSEECRRPLFAQVSAENPASIRLLERNGFTRIGAAHEPDTDRFLGGVVVTLRLD